MAVTAPVRHAGFAGETMGKVIFGLALLAALGGCAGATSDSYCIEHRHGSAVVTAAGVAVDPGRCTSWLFGPSAAQRAAFEANQK